MFITMKEYFNAKSMDLETIPYVFKSAQGFGEYIVFKNGIMGRLLKEFKNTKRCVWFPEQAKYLNKIIGSILNPSAPNRLRIENNNDNVIIFEAFGEVSVMWTIPIAEKIVNKFHEQLEGPYKLTQYIGPSIIVNMVNLGTTTHLELSNAFPQLTSVGQTSDDFNKRMEDDYQHIEACLGSEFMRLLTNSLNYTFIGYDDNAHYFKNDFDEVIRFSFRKDERVDRVKEKLSFGARTLINDCETSRL